MIVPMRIIRQTMNHLYHILCRPSWWQRLATPAQPGSHKVDPQAVRILVLLGLLAVLNLIDLRYTLFAHRAGMLNELNPIAANLLHLDLEPSLVCYKMLSLLVGSWMLWRLRRSPWCAGACWLLVVIYVALTVTWFLWTRNYTETMELRNTMNYVALQHGPHF